MEFEEARPFMESNHPGVISTYQRNGAIHNSIVVCGAYKGNAAFVAVRGNSRKVHNRMTFTTKANSGTSLSPRYVPVPTRSPILRWCGPA